MDQDKKKNTLIIIWSVAAAVFVAALAWLIIYLVNNPTYHNKQYRFSLVYPGKWKKFENFHGAPVAFIRPKKTALDTFEVNVNVSVQEVPDERATLAAFSETILKQMTAVFGPNMVVLADKDIRFAERTGHQLIIEGADPVDMKMMFIWTIKGSFAYILTFAAQQKQYKEEWPRIKKMIDSFKLQ